jgi:hypothetical protein
MRTLKYFAATFLLALVIAVCAHPSYWWVPLVIIGGFAALALTLLTVERLGDVLRRCPRCEKRGFACILEGERNTPDGDQFVSVLHCRQCELYRLECGAEVRELAPGRWFEEAAEWAGWDVEAPPGG